MQRKVSKRNFSMNCSVKKITVTFSYLVVFWWLLFRFIFIWKLSSKKMLLTSFKDTVLFLRGTFKFIFTFPFSPQKARVITLFYTWAQFKLFLKLVLKSRTKLVYMLHYWFTKCWLVGCVPLCIIRNGTQPTKSILSIHISSELFGW